MKLALGTVQFGLAYGIAGRGAAVPEDEVRSILAAAWDAGVRTLDTAAAYGDIEERLGRLCEGLDFRIVSKIPALPGGKSDADAVRWALRSAEQSRRRLGGKLAGLMLHRSQDLDGRRGEALWRELSAWALEHGVTLGVSCYAPADFVRLHEELGICLVQLPGNAFDQRIATDLPSTLRGAEIHLRSAFLQGLLLLPPHQAKLKLPQAGAALERWAAWCAEQGLPPLQAALSAVKSFAAVSEVVVGVDNCEQFMEISAAWNRCAPLDASALAVGAPEIIDPRLWKVAA